MIYRFGEYEFDASDFRLTCCGQNVETQRLVLDILHHLLRNRHRVVTKDELLQEAWRGVSVSSGAINQALSLTRRALGDDGDSQRFIRTHRGRGVQFVSLVEVISESPKQPVRAAPVFAQGVARLVGRDAEIALIEATQQEVLNGEGALVLVGGEPGIGKTTLLESAAERLGSCGTLTVWGRCREDRISASFWPWSQIVRTLLASEEFSRFGVPLAVERALLSNLSPTQRCGAPGRGPATRDARSIVFDSLSRVLSATARERPVAILLDDVHCADEPSLKLLAYVASQLGQLPVLVVATFRDTESVEGVWAAHLRELRERHRLSLRGLRREACSELLMQRMGSRPSNMLLEAAVRLTGGNPFLLGEVARTLNTLGTPNVPDELEAAFRLPDRGVTAARRALAALPEATRELLSIASVLGRDFGIVLLASLSSIPVAEVVRRLEPALSTGILRELGHDRCQFAHALLYQTLYQDLPIARRHALHRQAGERLERELTTNPELLPIVARHYFEALHEGAAASALKFSEQAAERAQAQLAFEEAATFYARAQKAAEMVACSRAPALLLRRAEALRCAGDTAEAIQCFERAAVSFREQGDGVGFTEAAIGYGATQQGFGDVRLIGLLHEALERCSPEKDVLRARAMAELAFALRETPEYVAARNLANEAARLARAHGDLGTVSRALFAYRWVAPGSSTPESLLSVSTEAVELARRSGDAELENDARIWKASDLLENGDADGFVREVELFAVFAERLKAAPQRLVAARFQVVKELLRGEFAIAEALAEEAYRLGRSIGNEANDIVHACEILLPRWEQGRFHELEPLARSMSVQLPWPPFPAVWRCLLARIFASTGRIEEARAEVKAIVERLSEIPDTYNYLLSLYLLAEAVVLVEDVESAGLVRDVLRPHASHHIVIGGGTLYLAPVTRYLGLMSLVLDDHGGAEAFFQDALEKCRRIGATHWIGRLSLDLARAKTRLDTNQARRQAASMAREALDIATMRGFAELQREAKMLLSA